METSIIIRIRNEKKNFEKLLTILLQQTYQNFEIIIVDDNSTDGSDTIAYNYFPKKRITVVTVPKDTFTYAHANNLGAEKAKGTYLVYISAHAYPIKRTWLADGLRNFDDAYVAGVFAYPLVAKETDVLKKIWMNKYPILYHNSRKIHTKHRMGLLGHTNAIIRKALWKKHQYDETYKHNHEDVAWACFWLKKGYVFVQDPKFRVYHSHALTWKNIFFDRTKWKSSCRITEEI